MKKNVQQTFIPGSKWLYLKIYSGHKTVDKILSNHIPFIVNKLYKEDQIIQWFFIRYADPDPHLRIRVLLKDEQFLGNTLCLFHQRLTHLVKDNLIWKIQVDTYNRELERYGNELIEDAESIFHTDSNCILSIIKKLNQTQNENHRWMIALKMIDCFLSDFALDLHSKQRLMSSRGESFKTEFGFNQYNSKQFNVKFREQKAVVESVLRSTITDIGFVKMYLPIQNRSKQLRPIIQQLKLNLKKQKNVTLESLISSYIHMMINRLFRSKNRLHELILYDFMRRYYESEMARLKHKTT